MKLRMLGALVSMFGVAALANANPPTYSITDLGLGTYISSIGNNNQVLARDSSGRRGFVSHQWDNDRPNHFG
jgi:hypothetical protein